MRKINTVKADLRDRCLPALKSQCAYFDLSSVRGWLKGARLPCAPATLNRYMFELTQAGVIWGAGRGWYSFIPTPFELDSAPVASMIAEIQGKFPFLDFACWSTQQVNPHMHHMLGKFVTFVEAPRDTMSSVFDLVKGKGFTAYLDPSKREVRKVFSVDERTVVVRPLVTKAPVQAHALRIEGILVDLSMELRTLPLLDIQEYSRMVANLVSSQRIDMAELISYARRRKVALDVLFAECESIISNYGQSWR